MDYITADLHFYHDQVITYNNRPFADKEEMGEKLIEEINRIPETSTLYIAGDFCYTDKKAKATRILERLRPRIAVIPGNHDRRLTETYRRFATIVSPQLEILYNGIKIVISHYPMYEWADGQRGSIHFHGHTHGQFEPKGKMLDVGWDAHGRILTMDEAIALADVRPIYQPCHSRNNGLHRHEVPDRVLGTTSKG